MMETEYEILMINHAFKLKEIRERLRDINKIRRRKKLKKWLKIHKN